MGILVTTNTTVLIQGMTGKEGQRALKWMTNTGLNVAAGVTPGKGGQEVEGVPVYNSVKEALEKHPEINVSSIYVPPKFVLSAATEALETGIKTIHVIGEGIPSLDTLKIITLARKKKARLVGPSSIGFATSGVGNVGSMGGGNNTQFTPPAAGQQGVAVISKSGGMSLTIANMLDYAGIPQTSVVGIGGDRLIGTTFADLLPDLKSDDQTGAVVIIGEIGGAYEEMLAQTMSKTKFSKPVIAFISGLFAENLPQGVAFGHAGAIVSKTEGTRDGKIKALQEAGAEIANKPQEIIELVKKHVKITT